MTVPKDAPQRDGQDPTKAGFGTLAIVIPVWNLPQDLGALLDQVADLGVFAQVIVVDDASDPPCDPAALGYDAARLNADLVALRAGVRGGAGHARNLGLASVTADHVLFFDADDRLSADFARIWRLHRDHPQGAPDFTIFRHHDTRVDGGGSFPTEEAIWTDALGCAPHAMLDRDAQLKLAMISAYPWNKIYRTDFLRRHDIACSESPVHNDIRLHWLGFAHARRVQAVRTAGATHVVGHRDHHLTTRNGEERLCLFPILSELLPALRAARAEPRLMQNFLRFADNICRWNLNLIDPSLIPRFRDLTKATYLQFTPDEFALFAMDHPDQAEHMIRFLMQESV